MYYGQMPLFPAMRSACGEPCVRVPLFDGDRCGSQNMPPMRECRRVTIENPCRPGECAEVILGVDACGNLLVCVHRDPRWDCGCRPSKPPRPRPDCRPDPCCRTDNVWGSCGNNCCCK